MNFQDIYSIRANVEDLGKYRRTVAAKSLKAETYERDGSPMPSEYGGPWALPGTVYDYHEVGYKTGTGNLMTMLVQMKYYADREQVPLLTEWEQVALCGDCKGSSGGCPGFAPRFSNMHRKVKDFITIMVSFDYIWSIMYATPEDGWLTRRIIKQMVYADRISENYCKRLLRSLQAANIGNVLGMGNCMGCVPKHCTVIKGSSCEHPDRRTFSMEAVGVDCDAIHVDLYGECLPWYYQRTSKIPLYMTRYTGIFPTVEPCEVWDRILAHIMKDKSYIPVEEVSDPRDASIEPFEIPTSYHKGDFQYVYIDPGAV